MRVRCGVFSAMPKEKMLEDGSKKVFRRRLQHLPTYAGWFIPRNSAGARHVRCCDAGRQRANPIGRPASRDRRSANAECDVPLHRPKCGAHLPFAGKPGPHATQKSLPNSDSASTCATSTSCAIRNGISQGRHFANLAGHDFAAAAAFCVWAARCSASLGSMGVSFSPSFLTKSASVEESSSWRRTSI